MANKGLPETNRIHAQHLSRRAFLRRVGQVSLGSAVARGLAARRIECQAASPTSLPATVDAALQTGPIPEADKSFVAHVRREEVVDGESTHPIVLREMIEDGVRAVTGRDDAGEAWNQILAPDDVIGVKFNQVGFHEFRTNDVFARELITSLGKAGFPPDRIMLIEVPRSLERELKTRPRVFGWSGQKVSFGSGEDELAALLQEVTAMINVPFLKTHNIAGMTGCLKNLSHAMVRRPARCHENGCAPYAGDIVRIPAIQSKLRLHMINALRALYASGPAVKKEYIWNHGGLIVSTDPVAADSVGTDIINDRRIAGGLKSIGNSMGQIAHLHAAAQSGLGTDDQDYIHLQTTAAW